MKNTYKPGAKPKQNKGLWVNGIYISVNLKTGHSDNHHSCFDMTLWCIQHCYRLRRTTESIARCGWEGQTTPNVAPITMPCAVAAYKESEHNIRELYDEGGLAMGAEAVAQALQDLGVEYYRGNGAGDLPPWIVEYYAQLAACGVKMFMFSKSWKMIKRLRRRCQELRVGHSPFVLGSLDPTTHPRKALCLVRETGELNGKPALAYAASTST